VHLLGLSTHYREILKIIPWMIEEDNYFVLTGFIQILSLNI
jgi:hypothetical protein